MFNNPRRLILMLALFASWSSAAQVISMEDVLGTVKDDQSVLRYQSIRDMASDLKMHDPLVKEIALRIGFNGSVLGDTIYGYLRNEDDLRLQVSFNALGVRQKQKQVKSARLQTLTTNQALVSHEALVDRYEALSDYVYALPELDGLKRLDSLLNHEHDIIKQMLATGILEVKVSRILDVEEDRNRVLLDIHETEDRVRRAKLEIEEYSGSFSSISMEQLASIDDLRQSFIFIKTSGYVAHPAHLALSAEMKMDSTVFAYASAQNRQILDYVSVGYQNPLYLDRPNRFNTVNNFAFRLGLLVPITANNRYRKTDALLDLKESEAKADDAWIEREQSWRSQVALLDGLFSEYALAVDRLDNSLIHQMLTNPTLIAHITPLELVELEIAQQKLVLNQLELVQDIASAYVELLSLSGYLAWNPDTNYLAKHRD
jgi:hypothetical protein